MLLPRCCACSLIGHPDLSHRSNILAEDLLELQKSGALEVVSLLLAHLLPRLLRIACPNALDSDCANDATASVSATAMASTTLLLRGASSRNEGLVEHPWRPLLRATGPVRPRVGRTVLVSGRRASQRACLERAMMMVRGRAAGDLGSGGGHPGWRLRRGSIKPGRASAARARCDEAWFRSGCSWPRC